MTYPALIQRPADMIAPPNPIATWLCRKTAVIYRLSLLVDKIDACRKVRQPISWVITARNDDYIEDQIRRLEAAISWNEPTVSEIIFVEWNPVPDRGLLSSFMSWGSIAKSYVVHPKYHAAISTSEKVPLLEYHAKNVGIRLATQPWILCGNPDVLFGADTICWLAEQELQKNKLYRVQRCCLVWDGRTPSFFSVSGLDTQFNYVADIDAICSRGAGDYMLAHRDLWLEATGFDETLTRHRWDCDIRTTHQMLKLGASIEVIGTGTHLDHGDNAVARPNGGFLDFDPRAGLPYKNQPEWGLNNVTPVKQTGTFQRVWSSDRVETWPVERIWHLN